jgi:hypothetical protein
MFHEDVDEFVFQRVRVVSSTARALLYAIGDRRLRLPRERRHDAPAAETCLSAHVTPMSADVEHGY